MEKHADVEIGNKAAYAPEESKNDRLSSMWIFFFQSLVLVALFPVVLRWSGRDTPTTVWRLSLLLGSYFYSAACVLSPASRSHKARLFVRLTYAALLVLVVEVVLSHAAGTLIMYLNSVWIAGVFGHALAEHRVAEDPAPAQEAREELVRELGSAIFLALAFSTSAMPPCFMAAGYSLEFVGALTLVICFLVPVAMHVVLGEDTASQSAAAPSSKESRSRLAGELGLIIFLALVLSACGLCPMCVIMAAPRGALLDLSLVQELLVALVPMVLCLCIPGVVIVMLKHLRWGAGSVVVLGVECDAGKVLVSFYGLSFMLFTLNFHLVSEVAAVVVLGLAVSFGYCVGLGAASACDGIDPWFLVRSKPKMVAPQADEVKGKQVAARFPKEQADVAKSKQRSALTTVPPPPAGKQTDG